VIVSLGIVRLVQISTPPPTVHPCIPQRVREVQAAVTGGPTAAYSIRVDNTHQAIDLTTSLQEMKTHYEVLATKSREEAFTQVQPRVRMTV